MNKQLDTNLSISSSLIKYEEAGEIIYQRIQDGYFNATAMCDAVGKEWFGYFRLAGTKDFITELSSSLNLPESQLVITKKGGREVCLQGTWIHPQIAMHLAQWLSPKFAVKVSKWVLDWMSGKKPAYFMPYHLKRYLMNSKKIPKDYFSVLQEINIALVAPLEQHGYILPGEIIPDISEGLMFASWLKEQGVDTDKMPTYSHRYEDGRIVRAKMYPLKYLVAFREHVLKIWLPKKAKEYFETRDKNALVPLEHILRENAAIAAAPFSKLPALTAENSDYKHPTLN